MPSDHRTNEQRVWKKGIDDCHCVNCHLTWDMHLADGKTSCPPPREDAMRAFNDLALAYGIRDGHDRANALRWFMLGRDSAIFASVADITEYRKWLTERVEWLKYEMDHGGDWKYLNLKREETAYCLEKLLAYVPALDVPK